MDNTTHPRSTQDFSCDSLDTIADQMLDNVLGPRQIGYTSDLENLYGQHRQTIWRRRKDGSISEAVHLGGRRAWTRSAIKADLVRALSKDAA